LTFCVKISDDFDDLIKHLNKPELRQGTSLQMELAECVRQSKKRVNTASPLCIQTLFISTIRRLINFPEVKVYIPPLITVQKTKSFWNLALGWKTMLREFLRQDQLATAAPVENTAWLLVAPVGQGKTRFTFALEKMIYARERDWQVVRVALRCNSNFLESCHLKPKKLENYVQYFATSCNLNIATNKKLVFIFDGYEKVCNLYGAVLEMMFKKILSDNHPLLVTTRPNAETEATKSKVCFSI
jgi:hypothetical protein